MSKTIKLQLGAVLTALALIAATAATAAVAPPAPAPAGGTLAGRVAQRKAERGTKLSKTDSTRLISTCVAAQIKLRAIQKDDVDLLAKRTKVYGSIDAKQWIVIGQLKLASQDTFPLEKQHNIFAGKVSKFQAIAGNYKQALDDTVVINCKADPTGFQALLDTTRIYYDQLHAQSTDTHDYVINTIKPTLKSYENDLQPKTTAGQEDQ